MPVIECELCRTRVHPGKVLEHIRDSHPEHLPHIEGWLQDQERKHAMTTVKQIVCDSCGKTVPAFPLPKGWVEVTALGSTPATRSADLCSDACLVAYIAAGNGAAYERIGRPAP
jgi:hypothetical protein